MPTYEFRCPSGHEFEIFYRKMSDAPATVHCPTCTAVAERKISGGAGLHFKGQGFYITDYGKDGKKDQRAAAKPASAKSDSAGSGSESSGKEKSSSGESSKSESSPKGESGGGTDKSSKSE